MGTFFLACFLLFDGANGVSTEERLLGACSTQCETPYGDVLGRSPGDVPAYSNCSSQCIFQEANQINDTYMYGVAVRGICKTLAVGMAALWALQAVT